MSNGMVSWRNYEGMTGFGGNASQGDVDALNKALDAGSQIDRPAAATAGDGFSLRVESLEQTLKNTTFRMEHIRLWKNLPKIPAYNTVEEYNQIQSYSNNQFSSFVTEGQLPVSTDATYRRQYAKIKFMGTQRSVSHVMSMVKPAHGNVIAQETIAGTMYLLEQLERHLFTGDSTMTAVNVASQAEGLEFDGLERLISGSETSLSDHIIDLRGAPLTEDNIIDGALTISDAPAFGRPTHLFLNPKAHSDLAKSFFPKARYDVFQKQDNGIAGMTLGGVTTQAGVVALEPDVFLDEGPLVPGTAAADAIGTSSSAGVAWTSPTVGAVTTPVNAKSQFLAGTGDHDAGNYVYRVRAVNEFGASAGVDVNGGAAFAVAAGDEVTFTITAGGATIPRYYEIFRSKRGGTALFYIGRVQNNGAGGTGAVTFQDFNGVNISTAAGDNCNATLRLPQSSNGFMLQVDPSNISFAQLAPMVKIPLATVDSSIRWMQLLYGAMKLYTPRHNVIYKNIGRAAGFVGAP
tara:strand:- start:5228 stop:6781 length:1554 start_codon:yes stop_codon:yes gene_type:complete